MLGAGAQRVELEAVEKAPERAVEVTRKPGPQCV
jgi:hypothetical protein